MHFLRDTKYGAVLTFFDTRGRHHSHCAFSKGRWNIVMRRKFLSRKNLQKWKDWNEEMNEYNVPVGGLSSIPRIQFVHSEEESQPSETKKLGQRVKHPMKRFGRNRGGHIGVVWQRYWPPVLQDRSNCDWIADSRVGVVRRCDVTEPSTWYGAFDR